MKTTKKIVLRDKMVGGMVRDTRPDLLSGEQWRTVFNFRPFSGSLKQVPRKTSYINICYSALEPIKSLSLVSTGVRDEAFVVGLSDTAAFRVTPDGGVRLLDEEGFVDPFVANEVYLRWATVMYHNELYFTNPLNPIRHTDGLMLRTMSEVPAGRYLEHYYDHLLVGAPTYNGEVDEGKVMWSHLADFTRWDSQTYTEADEYKPGEHSHGLEAVTGVTGVKRLGDFCYVYTPSSISVMRYVGIKNGVFRTDPLKLDSGCGFQYGLVSTGTKHFYPDLTNQTFMMFDGQNVQDIGKAIMPFVLENLNEDPRLAQRMWGYVDFQYNEVHWVFVSKLSTGDFDLEVVFNFESKTWYAASVEDVHSFCEGARMPKSAADLTGTINLLTGEAQSLSFQRRVIPRVWGSGLNYVLREEISTDELKDLRYQDLPFLETGDFYYQGLYETKELESFAIQASYATSGGIEVYYAVRDHFDETIAWTLAGIWTKGLFEKILSFPRVSGKIFRFKFVASATTQPWLQPVTFGGGCPEEGTPIVPPPPPIRWDCQNGQCVQSISGRYATQAECLATCSPPQMWICDNGVCRVDANGPYSSRAECEMVCGLVPPPDVLFCHLPHITANMVNSTTFAQGENWDQVFSLEFTLAAAREILSISVYQFDSGSIAGPDTVWSTKNSVVFGATTVTPRPLRIIDSLHETGSTGFAASLGTYPIGLTRILMFGEPFAGAWSQAYFYAHVIWADGTTSVAIGGYGRNEPQCGHVDPPCLSGLTVLSGPGYNDENHRVTYHQGDIEPCEFVAAVGGVTVDGGHGAYTYRYLHVETGNDLAHTNGVLDSRAWSEGVSTVLAIVNDSSVPPCVVRYMFQVEVICHVGPPPPPPPPYSCIDGVCQNDPNGQYTSLNQCADACGCSAMDQVNFEVGDCLPGTVRTIGHDWCVNCCVIPNYDATAVAAIRDAYRDLLCRVADCGGYQYWHRQWLANGWNAGTFLTAFQASSGYQYEITHGGGACGSCCMPDGTTCVESYQEWCRLVGGTFTAGGDCSPNPCGTPPPPPDTGSCCIGTSQGGGSVEWSCVNGVTEAQCDLLSGQWTAGGTCPDPAWGCAGPCPCQELRGNLDIVIVDPGTPGVDTDGWSCSLELGETSPGVWGTSYVFNPHLGVNMEVLLLCQEGYFQMRIMYSAGFAGVQRTYIKYHNGVCDPTGSYFFFDLYGGMGGTNLTVTISDV